MRKSDWIFAVLPLVAMLLQQGALARESERHEKASVVRLSKVLRPFPLPPIIVNGKPPRRETTASNEEVQPKRASCATCRGSGKQGAQGPPAKLRNPAS